MQNDLRIINPCDGSVSLGYTMSENQGGAGEFPWVESSVRNFALSSVVRCTLHAAKCQSRNAMWSLGYCKSTSHSPLTWAIHTLPIPGSPSLVRCHALPFRYCQS